MENDNLSKIAIDMDALGIKMPTSKPTRTRGPSDRRRQGKAPRNPDTRQSA
jgi:hypothetical protein